LIDSFCFCFVASSRFVVASSRLVSPFAARPLSRSARSLSPFFICVSVHHQHHLLVCLCAFHPTPEIIPRKNTPKTLPSFVFFSSLVISGDAAGRRRRRRRRSRRSDDNKSRRPSPRRIARHSLLTLIINDVSLDQARAGRAVAHADRAPGEALVPLLSRDQDQQRRARWFLARGDSSRKEESGDNYCISIRRSRSSAQ
jgi:hypothetical protein